MAKDAILVFGASGQIGLDLCAKLRAQGTRVIGAIRAEKGEAELRAMGADVAKVDLFDPASVDQVIADAAADVDLVISVFGGPIFVPPEELPDGTGNIFIIDSMQKHGIKRFLFMTSIGCGKSWAYQNEMVQQVLGTNLKEKDKAEEHLQKSDLEWIILRPGGLGHPDNPMKPLEPTGNGVMYEHEAIQGYVARGDVADMLVDLSGPKGDKALGKILAAVDKDIVTIVEGEATPFTL